MAESGRSSASPRGQSVEGEQRPTDEMIRQSGEPFRLLVESVKDYAIFVLDEDGNIVTWNRGAENIKGYRADEIIGKHFSIFYPQDAVQMDIPGYELKVAAEVGRFEDEGWRIRKDGSRFWANVVITALRDETGALRGFGKVTRDLTERKKAEEQRLQLAREQAARSEAEAASRAKDEFLATVSHELRSPLNAILGWGRILRDLPPGSEGFSQAVESIERNAHIQAKLIEDLLDVSRIIAGKLRVVMKAVDPGSITEAAIDSIRPAANARGIDLQVMLEPNVGLVMADPDRLQQILWNLLSNAVKFTGKGGRVDVRLGRVGSNVNITVSDTGKGISPEFLPYVFDRFRQADSSVSRMHGGLGLGLAIVRHLVELHGGDTKAESAGEGLGATFTVTLPVTRDPDRIAEDRDSSLAGGPAAAGSSGRSGTGPVEAQPIDSGLLLAGTRILVVDDMADARELVRVILEGRGAKVTCARSAQEAYEIIEWLKPDCIISDIGMSPEDGYSFIRNVRLIESRDGRERRPAVAVTAHARMEDRLHALAAGYQSHIAKPVDPVELIAVITSLVRTN